MGAHLGGSVDQQRDDGRVGLVGQVLVQHEQHVLHAVVGWVLAAVGGIQLAVPLEEHLQHHSQDLQQQQPQMSASDIIDGARQACMPVPLRVQQCR